MKKPIQISSDKVQFRRIKRGQCPQCGTSLGPDLESKVFGTDKWDGHTFKFRCDCPGNPKVRVMIG